MIKRRQTFVLSKPDSRDYISGRATTGLPAKIDFRADASVRLIDQRWGELCTGAGFVNILDILAKRDGKPEQYSPLYAWEQGKKEAGVQGNVGIPMRDLIKAAIRYGCATEAEYSLDLTKIGALIPDAVVTSAMDRQVLRYESCGAGTDASLMQIKAQLTAGVPIFLGLKVSNSLQNLKTFTGYKGIGMEPWFGHAVAVVGYDDAIQSLIIENSWGTGFGEKGFFALPYSVYRTDSYEAWAITSFSFTKPVPVLDLSARGPRIYLEGDQMFRISSPNCKVYGSAFPDSVVIDQSATDTTLDGNIDEVHIPWLDDPKFRAVGNKLEIFTSDFSRNGPQIATVTYNERPLKIVLPIGSLSVGFNGGITVNGKKVSTISPESV